MGLKNKKKSVEKSSKGNKNTEIDNLHPKCYKYKFNISMDNLKCFISPFHQSLPKRGKCHSHVQNTQKLQTCEKQCSISNNNIIQDLTKQLSNEILSQIENKGISYLWNDVDELKSENQCEEKQICEVNQYLEVFSQSCPSLPNSYEKNNSFNSTIDHYSSMYKPQFGVEYISYNYIKDNDPCIFQIDVDSIGRDPRTTLMIKNIPNKYTIQNLSMQIDQNNSNNYDFLYLPCDIKNNCNIGYGFINFINTEVLKKFYKAFHNKRWKKFKSQKICILTYARLQGLSSLIEHFQNTKVLNHKDKKYQPIIIKFDRIQNLIRTQQKGQVQF